LLEAVATWGAGDYWNEWREQSSFESSVAAAVREGRSIDLDRGSVNGLDGAVQLGQRDDCERDLFYTHWAAFIGYLVDLNGIGRLVELQTRPALRLSDDQGEEYLRADYRAVYGARLPTLTGRWLRTSLK
jgi:hypothetical protein